jgi:predicted transcriptional regulator
MCRYIERVQTDNSRPATMIVQTVNIAKLLFEERTCGLLKVLFAKSVTVSQLAAETGMHESTTLGAVRRLEAAGLVVVDGQTQINGRRLICYRASADQFIVPLPLLEDFMLRIERRFQEDFNEHFTHTLVEHHYNAEPIGVRVRLEPGAGVSYSGVIGDDHEYFPGLNRGPLIQFSWRNLQLSADEARLPQVELEAIADRYTFPASIDRKPYLVGTHLTPCDR